MMSRLSEIPRETTWFVDLESNNLYDEATDIWCVVYRNFSTDQVIVDTVDRSLSESDVAALEGSCFVGHNIIGYDVPMLRKFNKPVLGTRFIDTFLLSQILSPERKLHSLESYYPESKIANEDWSTYRPIILERCISDTLLTKRLFEQQLKILESWDVSDEDFLDLETAVLEDVSEQSVRGCPVDELSLDEHITFLTDTIEDMNQGVQDILGTYIGDTHTYDKPFTMSGGYKAFVSKWAESVDFDLSQLDGPFTRVEFCQVRLTQHDRVKAKLLELGWKPVAFTDKGNPKLPSGDEWDDLAESTGSPELSQIALYGGYKNRLDILLGWKSKLRPSASGDFKVVSHGAFTCGTPTSRFRHQVIVNVPRPSSLFGNEMRSLIYCPYDDYVQVGWDLSGIELRMLAHYMNDKDFIDLVADPEGDIHTFFWEKVTHLVASRDNWKNVFYGYSYGATDPKLGTLCTALPPGKRTPKAGATLRDTIETSTPSLGKLVAGVQKASLRGYIKGLDGRRVSMKTGSRGRKTKIGGTWVDNPKGVVAKDALNRLLQSGAAIVFKRAVKMILDKIKDKPVKTLIYYHDEGQNFVHKDFVDEFKEIVTSSVREAGEYYNLRIPLDCDIKVGRNWMECH